MLRDRLRSFARTFHPLLPGVGTFDEYVHQWPVDEIGRRLARHTAAVPLLVDYRVPAADLVARTHDPTITVEMVERRANEGRKSRLPLAVYFVAPALVDPFGDGETQPLLGAREALFLAGQHCGGKEIDIFHLVRFPARDGNFVPRFCGGSTSYVRWVGATAPLAEGECWGKVVDAIFIG